MQLEGLSIAARMKPRNKWQRIGAKFETYLTCHHGIDGT